MHASQLNLFQFKGYIRYRTITSQDMSSEAQIKNLMTSHILKYADLTNTQKYRYLENKTFFLQIKKFIIYT